MSEMIETAPARAKSSVREMIEALDAPMTRPLLALGASMAATAIARRPARVGYDGRFWFWAMQGWRLPRDRRFTFYRFDFERMREQMARYQFEARDCWGPPPNPGDIVIDIGAGIGTDTIFFSRAVGAKGRIIAIEAAPETFARLQSTVRLNRLDNVIMIGKAVADKTCRLRISTDGDDVAAHLADEGGVEVQADTIDNMLAPLNLPRIDLVKMNIEGAERLAIKGMRDTGRRARRMAIACHDFIGGEWFETKTEVRAWMESAGFRVSARPDDPRAYVRDHLYGER